ncbi:MAG: hypothetical protein M1816_007164 [Peltula sp. TS41687]|nr:MAG: hypothetical protein M1816_007164 [Peltula sp. TS41687]
MAANDYYNSPSWNGRSRVDYDAPLPPLPPAVPGKTSHPTPSASPFATPFDDHVYPTQSYDSKYGHIPEYSFDGSTTGSAHGPGPSSDYIPLTNHPASGTTTNARPLYNAGFGGGIADDGGIKGRQRRKRGFKDFEAGKRIPWFVYAMSLIQLVVFLVEIIRNANLTKSPIMIKPQFNPMIGPSTYVLINMGARFVPCMRSTNGVQDSKIEITWPCPNTTSLNPSDPSMQCSLSQLCGFSGVPNPKAGGSLNDQPQPNQWYRFIIPIFLHAGIIHIAFNLLLQLTMGRDMEKAIGWLRFALVYFSSGIFGFVLGGNFAASGIASTGASGCLFGILALTLLDLLYGWKERRSPVKDLAFIILDIVISFILGLLPGLDNFSHIGGFLMGLVLGICILHSPNALRQRIGQTNDGPYTPVMTTGSGKTLKKFIRQPLRFFKGRKLFWWVWWIFRAGALFGVLAAFIVLLNNFYKYRTECKWCKYLSCLPINNWCDLGNLQTPKNTTTTPSNPPRF